MDIVQNIIFNDKNYSIDESSLAPATAELKNHISTVMNGSGATINFDGAEYSIDSAKLSAATNDFVSHLSTIAGNGSKVVVGGVEYSVDSTKVRSAVSELEAAWGNLNNLTPGDDGLEGDGVEYYTAAPTTLSFRSTEPLDEFQEIQVNGQTIDQSNYTLTEGSTIATLSIDYLKTLSVGKYEIAIVSKNKIYKEDFYVNAPVVDASGIYFNQPYSAFVDMYEALFSLVVWEQGIGTVFVSGTPAFPFSYTIDDGVMTTISDEFGELTFTISSNDKGCKEKEI